MNTELLNLLKPQTHYFGKRETHGINARLLHQGLGVGRMYAHWIKARIKQGRFIENLDYIVVQNSIIDLPKLANQKGGNLRAVEYILSLDMAKHLCLMEKTEIAHAIRQHFIDCEKQLSRIAPNIYRNTLAQTQARLEAIDHNRAMTDAIQACLQRQGKSPKPHHFSLNQELIDSLVLGENVRKWKAKHGILGRVRDRFNPKQLALLKLLLQTNATLINLDMPYQDRKAQLQKLSQRYLVEHLAA